MEKGSKQHIESTLAMIDALLLELRMMAESEDLDVAAYEEALASLDQNVSSVKTAFLLSGRPSGAQKISSDHDPFMPDGRRRNVLCVELRKAYDTIAEAHRETGINSGNLYRALKGELRRAGGYTWVYIDPK